MLSVPYWLSDPTFDILRSIIFTDSLVCLTGAGISRGLKRQSDGTKRVPDWWELLDELRVRFTPADPQAQKDIDLLLKERSAPGDWLIQAATIMREEASDKDAFDSFVRQAVEATDDPSSGTSETHRAIASLGPRGIMTFNYDKAHELVISELGDKSWIQFTSYDEDKMRDLMRSDFSERFLLKAHGSIDRAEQPLVLDLESYRRLMSKAPTYRAFVGRLLTQFSLLIAGFGMSDPDFDQFLRSISFDLGGHVRRHVLITRVGSYPAEAVVLQRRYGIHTLALTEWDHLPRVLAKAAESACTEAIQITKECIDGEVRVRQAAHLKLGQLSIPGKRVASTAIRDALKAAIARGEIGEAAEYIYSLGKLGPSAENKALLLGLLAPDNHREVIAHAVLALDGKLSPDDTPLLEDALKKLTPVPKIPEDPKFPDPDNRIPLYLAYLIAHNRRRAAEYDPSMRATRMPFDISISERKALV